jgi:drug/metabolite transporter (DMT)-like permease
VPFFRTPVSALGAGAFIISFSSIFSKLSGEEPIVNAFYRMFFGAVFLLALAYFSKSRFLFNRSLFYSALAGIFLSCDLVLWHTGIELVGPGLSTLLANFQVFFLAFYDAVAEKKPPSLKLFSGMVLAMCGLYILVSPGWEFDGGGFRNGVFFSLGAGALYSCFTILMKKSSQTPEPIDKIASISSASVASFLFLGVLAYASGGDLIVESGKDIAVLTVYGVLCQGLGWVLITGAIRAVPLGVTGLVLLLQPTLSWVWEVIIFAKPVVFSDITGALLAMSAIYIGGTAGVKKNVKDGRNR